MKQWERMREKQASLTHARLLEILSYNPVTGMFLWLTSNSNRVRVGDQAGSRRKDSRIICIDGKKFPAHRLAWFYVNGVWPNAGLDHRDLDWDNNAILNLREATQAQNVCNVKVRRHNRSGIKGAHWHAGARRWYSRIGVNRGSIYLGLFDTPEAAGAAYAAASIKHHGEFGRGM